MTALDMLAQVDCGQCEGTGETDAMGFNEQCPVCDGSGKIDAKPTVEERIDFENWVELRVGETGTMIAYLEAVHFDGGVTVKDASWDNMVLDCPAPKLKLPASTTPLGTLLCWRVRRTEDGLDALACWEKGKPPIPLQEG